MAISDNPPFAVSKTGSEAMRGAVKTGMSKTGIEMPGAVKSKTADKIADYFKKIRTPQYYQGRNKRGGYFEGWYFKQEKDGGCYCFIAGIYKGGSKPHSFIQVIKNTENTESHYFEFGLDEFSASDKELYIKIGDNIFSAGGISLSLKKHDFELMCDIKFGRFTTVPNVMGFFALLPGLQCNHTVVSLSHTVSGTITDNGKITRWDKGAGYIEKDFGSAFPDRYIWLHTNINDDLIITFAQASVPVCGKSINGHICIIKYKNKLYNLSTYAFGKVRAGFNGDKYMLEVRRGKTVLRAEIMRAAGAPLYAPVAGGMGRTVYEGLCLTGRAEFSTESAKKYCGEGLFSFESFPVIAGGD